MCILHKEDPLIKVDFCSYSHQSNMSTLTKYIVFAEFLHGADILDSFYRKPVFMENEF